MTILPQEWVCIYLFYLTYCSYLKYLFKISRLNQYIAVVIDDIVSTVFLYEWECNYGKYYAQTPELSPKYARYTSDLGWLVYYTHSSWRPVFTPNSWSLLLCATFPHHPIFSKRTIKYYPVCFLSVLYFVSGMPFYQAVNILRRQDSSIKGVQVWYSDQVSELLLIIDRVAWKNYF